MRRLARQCYAVLWFGLAMTAHVLAQDTTPAPKPASIPAAAPTPAVIAVPTPAPSPTATPITTPVAAPPFNASTVPQIVPHSGIGGVIVDEGQPAVDITAAVVRYQAPDTDGSTPLTSYLADFVNRSSTRQVRIILLDSGMFGGVGAPAHLTAAELTSALSSNAQAPIEIIEGGVRTKVRLTLPPNTTVSVALRYNTPVDRLTVEMWDERSLARFSHAAIVMQGALLGLVTAIGAWLAGMAIQRGDRLAWWLAALFGAALIALVSGFGLAGVFSLFGGVITNAGVALGSFAVAAALALWFVVQALAPDGRWQSSARLAVALPWLVGISGFYVLINGPFASVICKAAIMFALVISAVVILVRAYEGDALARRLSLAATPLVLSFAPLGVQETGMAGGGIAMLASAGLLVTALFITAFAILGAQPRALRQRVDHLAGGARGTPAPAVTAETGPAQARYVLALTAAHQGVWDWDLITDRLFLSPAAEISLGARPGELRYAPRNWAAYVHADDLETFTKALTDYRAIGDVSFALDFRARADIGPQRWLQLRASFMSDGSRAARCIGLLSDISSQKEGEALLLASARTDSVTGLANRVWFMEALAHRLSFATDERPLVLLLIDLARFSMINSGIGPKAGDELLAEMAGRLKLCVPAGALAARLGGDVFAVMWLSEPQTASADVAQFMLDTLAVPYYVAGHILTPVVRGGLALSADTQADPALLAGDAEMALARARRSGVKELVLFTPDMRAVSVDGAALERDLAHAGARGEITVYYQPIIKVADGSLSGFEALLRWQHPERGLLSADRFAALAEHAGLIGQLGEIAMRKAAADAATWRQIPGNSTPVFVNVNMSARQLADEAFLALCEELAASYGLEHGEIRIEITETVAIHNIEDVTAAMLRLRRAGYGLVMDDFGAGHSTLRRLTRLPFDGVKIDASFLATMDTGAHVLPGLLKLAHDLKLPATVEGVETAEQLQLLAEHDCPYAQGYYCGRPSDAVTATQLLARERAAQQVA